MEYISKFREEAIDFPTLQTMSEDQLAKLGVKYGK